MKISFVSQNLVKSDREKFRVDKKVLVSEKKFLVECCARKSYQSPLGKTKDHRLYPAQEIRAISRIIKTMSTLFQNQQTTPVGGCHDVDHISYEYNRTRPNQSIESLYWNRKETTHSAFFHKKLSKKSK